MSRVVTALALLLFFGSLNVATAQQYSDLLKDRSLSQWMIPNGNAVEKGWQIENDGTLHLSGKGDNIVTQCHD